MSATEESLDDLTRRRQTVENYRAQPVVIRHLPTPLAKTVFGKEEHFRLLGGRIVYVPMNELVAKLRAEWRQKIWKLKNAPSITETIGPVRGFRMRYTLRHAQHVTQTSAGMVRQSVIELDGFELVQAAGDLGEPIDEALAPGSAFRSILAGSDPQQTTVTIWTYPDSFDAFRRVKQDLYKLGFLTAGRPMPDGMPIGGSPQGSKSSAE